jgi:hypothetical protein
MFNLYLENTQIVQITATVAKFCETYKNKAYQETW